MSDGAFRRIESAVAGLDRWFDTMRVDWPVPGYGGPVVHWWRHSLAYRGTGLDWRYEGIIDGYLTLYRRTENTGYLDKAIRAGLDLVTGQIPNGQFMNSGFERNPERGGTPHEAAADIGLLLLAGELGTRLPELGQRFLDAAQRNLQGYWFGQLWQEETALLWDSSVVSGFVPNKAATFIEATLLLSKITYESGLVERYARPTGERILSMQVRRPGHLLDGAIAQNMYRDQTTHAYFPLYIARCVPPLLQLSAATSEPRFRHAALAAAAFIDRVREPDGSFPQVLYTRGRKNRYPRWVAGAGDMVRAMSWANAAGAAFDIWPTVTWLLRGVRPDGRIVTADGFGRIVRGLSKRNKFADELGVVGWADKAFRALAELAGPVEFKAPTTNKIPLYQSNLAEV